MYILLKRIKLLLLLILFTFIFPSNVFAANDINEELDELSKIDHLAISDFIELVDSNKENNIFVLDLKDGTSYPILNKNKDIQSIKKVIKENKGISSTSINDKEYKQLFKDNEIKFIKNNKREFAIFIENSIVNIGDKNTIPIVFSGNIENVQVRINGNLKDPSIITELDKGKSYELTFYRNGKDIGNYVVDLNNFTGETYIIEIPQKNKTTTLISIVSGMIFILFGSYILYIKKIRNTHKENELLIIGDCFFDVKEICINGKYESIINRKLINKIEKQIKNLKHYKEYIIDHNTTIIDSNKYMIDNQINEINGKIKIVAKILEDKKEDINEIKLNLSKLKIEDKKYVDNIQNLEDIIYEANEIFQDLTDLTFKMNNIVIIQNEIISKINDNKKISLDASNITIDIDKAYKNLFTEIFDKLNMINNQQTIQGKMIEKQNGKLEKIISYIQENQKILETIDKNIVDISENINKESDRICKCIKEGNDTIYKLIEKFDKKMNKSISSQIENISKYINELTEKIDSVQINMKDQINKKDLDEINKKYLEKLEKLLDCKFENIEKITNSIMDQNKNRIKEIDINISDYLDEKALKKVSEDLELKLITAEDLYENIDILNIKDYSCIYIMYSKILESELCKKTNLNENKAGLNDIEERLKYIPEWKELINILINKDIRGYRNAAAHKGIININQVKIIRDTLLKEKRKQDNLSWLNYIIIQD